MIVNTGTEVITSAIISAYIAQFMKFGFYYIKNKKINFKTLAETGGMPSSHTSAVVSLSTTVGIILGFNSVECAIAFGYALVVMYDAAGLRRATGKIAAQLNRVVDEIWENRPPQAKDKLMELLGHTPLEVVMGAILGVVFSFLYHYVLLS